MVGRAAVVATSLERGTPPRTTEVKTMHLQRSALALTQPRAQLDARSSIPPATEPWTLDELVGWPSMEPMSRELLAALHTELPILVLGESGTGKTLLAGAIAAASGRGPVVRAMLGSSDDANTVASELFGHERGAFSGAVARRVGLVEHAADGIVVLDEILNLAPHVQQLLLDFTQYGHYRPLGYSGRTPRQSRARIIAATNGDLDEAVRRGGFRFDLLQRLSGIVVTLPPLRDRRGEIPDLAATILRKTRGSQWQLSRAARSALGATDLEWRGNVRELELLLTRACGRARAERADAHVIEPAHLGLSSATCSSLPPALEQAAPSSLPDAATHRQRWDALRDLRARLEAEERALLEGVVARHRGVLAHAARELGIPRTTLIGKLRVLGVERSAWLAAACANPLRE